MRKNIPAVFTVPAAGHSAGKAAVRFLALQKAGEGATKPRSSTALPPFLAVHTPPTQTPALGMETCVPTLHASGAASVAGTGQAAGGGGGVYLAALTLAGLLQSVLLHSRAELQNGSEAAPRE